MNELKNYIEDLVDMKTNTNYIVVNKVVINTINDNI